MARTVSEVVHCVVCGVELTPERKQRKGTTCSDEHRKLRKAQLRQLADQKECRYCRRPSTPAQRGEYIRWHNVQKMVDAESLALLKQELPALTEKLGVRFQPLTVIPLLNLLIASKDGEEAERETEHQPLPSATA